MSQSNIFLSDLEKFSDQNTTMDNEHNDQNFSTHKVDKVYRNLIRAIMSPSTLLSYHWPPLKTIRGG